MYSSTTGFHSLHSLIKQCWNFFPLSLIFLCWLQIQAPPRFLPHSRAFSFPLPLINASFSFPLPLINAFVVSTQTHSFFLFCFVCCVYFPSKCSTGHQGKITSIFPPSVPRVIREELQVSIK